MDTRGRCGGFQDALPQVELRRLCPACLMRQVRDPITYSDDFRGPLDASRLDAAPGSIGRDNGDALTTTLGLPPRIPPCDSAVDPAARPSTLPAPPDSSAAAPAAHLRLFGEIARGGMGTVLKGRDEHIGRDLAVKVLLAEHRDRTELARRFVEEAQIGGQLQHPGIVPIYELGTFADGRPYFTMKLVRGRTLAALLAERSSPSDGLPRFLSIFEQVCRAVAYAHARGVIHRDLKPSNVMVGGFGEVQVMDWGLAKVLSRERVSDDWSSGEADGPESAVVTARGPDSDLSRAGSVMGTPAYMSPEQARGEVDLVDERADVFALGAILCEILTGVPAFAGCDPAEVQRRAARGGTSEALARLGGYGADAELVRLAVDCLAVESGDRPRDADAVSERIGSYLAGVQERLRAAELERARAEAHAAGERKRRKLQLALVASILALTTLGGLSIAYAIHQSQVHIARADRLLARATLLRDQARGQPDDVSRWEQALAVLNRIVDDIDPGQGPAATAPVVALRREMQAGLEAAAADRRLLDRLVDIRGAQADDRDGWPTTDAAYAEAFGSAGLAPDAVGPAEAGARIAGRPAPVASALLAALDHWTAVRRERAPTDLGWTRLLAAARAADPDPDRDALRAALLIEDRAVRLQHLRPLASRADAESWSPDSLVLLGEALASSGDADAGLAVLHRASGSYPGDARLHYALGLMLEQFRPSRPEEVIRALSIARALQPELGGHHLAHELERRGRDMEAEAVWRDLVRRRPGDGYHLGCFGRYLKGRGRAEEAATVLDRAIALLRASIELNPGLPSAHINLGNALWDRGDLEGAISNYREASRLDPKHMALHPLLIHRMRSHPGPSGGRSGAIDPAMTGASPGEAESCFERAKDLDRSAHRLSLAGRTEESLAMYRKALAAARELARLDPGSLRSLDTLGSALAAHGEKLLELKRWPEAGPLLREALKVREEIPIDSWPRYYTAGALGEALAGLGRFSEAEPLILSGYEGVEARKDTIGDREAFYLGEVRRRVVWLYDQWGRGAKAAEWRTKLARDGRPDGPRPDPGPVGPRRTMAEVEDLLKSFHAADRAAFSGAHRKLEAQLDRGGPAADAIARGLLERKAEIIRGADVEKRLDEVAERDSAARAAGWLLAIAKARHTVGIYGKGHVAVGRLVVEDGRVAPELVMAQMPILPGGYFAGEVGDLARPLTFRSHGYGNLDVPLKGKGGDLVALGTVVLKPLQAGRQASLTGSISLDNPGESGTTSVELSIDVGPINTPHNGYSPRPRWPEPLRLPVSNGGRFAASGLSPTRYVLAISANGHVRSTTVVDLAAGVEHDCGALRLRSSDLGFYIGKPAPRSGGLAWGKDYRSALKRARSEHKPLLVMMTATWCGPCKRLEEETLNDPWIRHFLSGFILVKAYEDRDVERRYGMEGYPTLVFAREGGEPAHKTAGYQPPLSIAGQCLEAYRQLALEPPAELRTLFDAGVIPGR